MEKDNHSNSKLYWDETSAEYQDVTRIATNDFHYGPLLPGDSIVGALPEIKRGMKCLELGAGVGQNSIFLASQGAHCLATDISAEQLKFGETIANAMGLNLDFEVLNLDELDPAQLGFWDFIHSTWAFPFSADQETLVSKCAQMLKKGGRLHITTGHPIFAGEWIELEEHEQGMFVSDYFTPPREVRFTKDEEFFIRTQQFPLSTYINWIIESGLTLKRVLELKPVDLDLLSKQDFENSCPYDSEIWREMYPQIKKIPFVVTYIAEKL